jgi:ribosomal protein L37AE/L43A
MAPDHLMTIRQLAARGLRPGGQGVQAQVLWASRRAGHRDGVRAAYLYDIGRAKPKRTPTDRQREALARALAARRRCPDCGRDVGYVLRRSLGVCNDCDLAWRGAA